MGGKVRLSLGFVLLVGCLVFAGMAWGRTVAVVGDETIEEEEVLALLRQHTEGSDALSGVLLSRMSAEERRAYIESLADWLLLAREATLRGLRLRPDVAVFLKWSAIGILGQAYLAELRKEWDFSEAALRAQYEAHAKRYAEEDAVRLRWCVAPDENRANRMLLDLLGESLPSLPRGEDNSSGVCCVDTDWLRRDALPQGIVEEIFRASPGTTGGPISTEEGYVVFRLLQRREGHLLSFEEAEDRVREDLRDVYLQREMERVRQKANISMDEMVLMDLGNIPAR
ncbi:peptidyl-prolyl cis-trans isomerase [Aminiphilus circumscriptus]|uniref:peptidylprolyl isomerase n=1 Tax=Aminiphilus circumscriptus TaxID=290732 RepID=UPI0004ACAFA1|nr:peptidyl-prolyl cis-trans isomerase [Aminiphilus circumscriptus]